MASSRFRPLTCSGESRNSDQTVERPSCNGLWRGVVGGLVRTSAMDWADYGVDDDELADQYDAYGAAGGTDYGFGDDFEDEEQVGP